jgi:hypothetical protein
MSETEIYYEMLWDCAQCNTRGLLGDSHRHCPTCGAAQDPAKRYFPQPGEEVEARNHQFVGADWRCVYCSSPNSAAAAHCTNCGAGQDGTKPVAIVVDTAAAPASVQVPQPAAPSAKRWWWALALLVLAAITLGVLFTSKQDATASVTSRTWQREIQIEQFGPVAGSAWCDSLPGDAYAITQSREQRSTQRIEDGQTCREERIDKGDGTFVKHRECTPRYREQPIYDNRCRYQVNRWHTTRSLKAGSDTAAMPLWPGLGSVNSLGSGMGQGLGAERPGARSERYVLSLQSGGKTWSCDVPEAVWAKYTEGANVPVQVRRIGGVDCGSLK